MYRPYYHGGFGGYHGGFGGYHGYGPRFFGGGLLFPFAAGALTGSLLTQRPYPYPYPYSYPYPYY